MKKAVKDLQPGDIVTVERSSQIILEVRPARYATRFEFKMYSLERGEVWESQTPVPGDTVVDAQGERAATPEDIDQLIEIARAWISSAPPSMAARAQAQALIHKLSPPNPPTFEELLEFVRRMSEPPRAYVEGQMTPFEQCADIVERARHAGLLK